MYCIMLRKAWYFKLFDYWYIKLRGSPFAKSGGRGNLIIQLPKTRQPWSLLYGGPQVSRKNLLSHGKTFFLTAKLSFSRQNFLSHGRTFFLTARLSFSWQNFLSHGKTSFLTAKLSFSRQNFLSHGKTYFLTAKLTFLW